MSPLIFINVERKDVADLNMEFDGGESHSGVAVVLECLVVNAETTAKETLTLVVPKSTGYDLVRHLLTEDQWEAVTCV